MSEIDLSQFEEIPEESAPAESAGIDLSQFEELNPLEDGSTPTSAMPESPVGLMDRAKLALGNVKGNVNYLKKNFEEVQYIADKGLVVKEKGVWKQVDPSALGGDGWTISEAIKDLVEGGASLAAPALGAAKGATIGTAAAGPIGGVAGAFVGGASGKVAMSSVLGRYVGTYQPESVQDELEDIALEGLFAAGGEVVRVGAKPTFQALSKAYKSIGKSASEGTKDALAATLGRTTAAGSDATRFMFDNTDDVAKTITTLKQTAKGTDDLIRQASRQQLKVSEKWLEGASKALPRKYGQLLDDLAGAADDAGLEVDVGTSIQEALKEFSKTGYGKVVAKGSNAEDQALAGLLESLGRSPEQIAKRVGSGSVKLELVRFSQKEIAERTAAGLPVKGVNDEIFGQIKDIFDTVNNFSKVPKLKGSKAARALQDINKELNAVFAKNADPAVKAAASQASAVVKSRFGQAFEKSGLSDEWSSLNKVYDQFGDAVARARNLLNAPDGAEQFYNSLLANAGKKVSFGEDADLLVALTGKLGESARRRIQTLEAAKRFAPILPKFGLAQGFATSAGTVGLATGAANPALIAGAASTFSPRTMLRATQGYRAMSNASSKYAMTFVQALKTLPPKSLKQAMAHPDLIRTAAMATMHAMGSDEEDAQRLLEQEFSQ